MTQISVVQDWVTSMTLKQQTVVLSAIRGCDGAPKDDPSKPFVRALRSTVLKNAVEGPCSFMSDRPTINDIEVFVKSFDHYPVHWLMHFIHAVECVGYGHSNKQISGWWLAFYHRICHALHVGVELYADWALRLIDGPPSDCWKV